MSGKSKIVILILLIIFLFPFRKTVHGWGVVVAPKDVIVSSLFRGVAESVYADFGTDVKKGDPLLKILLIGTPNDELKAALTNDEIFLNELKTKENEFKTKKISLADVDFMKAESDIQYYQHEIDVLNSIFGKKTGSGQITYDVVSSINGKVNVVFPKASAGNYLNPGDDLFSIHDPSEPKYLLCILEPNDLEGITKGCVVESVPILDWKYGLFRMTGVFTGEVLNRDQLESYVAEQPQVFDGLFNEDGSRKEYGAFLANDLKCDRLDNLPNGMIVAIDVDRGVTFTGAVIFNWFKRVYFFLIDHWW
jgi:hypothetical protein